MQAYSIETMITKDGTIQLDSLPFPAGETVQVIVLSSKAPTKEHKYHALKGIVLKYENPLEPVSQVFNGLSE